MPVIMTLALILLVGTSSVSSSSVGERVLQVGMQGNDVYRLQESLVDLGHSLEVDGIFGRQTQGIIREIQRDAGLTADGIVGPATKRVVQDLLDRLTVYVVQSGDTLYDLAALHGTTVAHIQQVNRLRSSMIRPGQELRIISGGVLVVTNRTRLMFRWPLQGPISSPYGWRIHPVSKVRDFHGGIDIAVPQGSVVKASADGVVIRAGWMGTYGYGVIIDHGAGYTSWYGHNSKLLVRAGEQVVYGQPIAHVGSTGLATGPHLDFRIKIMDQTVNPLEYLQ